MPDANDFTPGPKLRTKLGISAVTLWRWRHNQAAGFPSPKVIKGRLYFPVGCRLGQAVFLVPPEERVQRHCHVNGICF